MWRLSYDFLGVSAQRSPSQLPLAPAQPSRVPEAEVHTAASACLFLVGGGVASTGFFCLWRLTPPAPACAFQVLSRFPQTLPVNAASCALVKTRGSRLWPQPRSLRCALPCQHTALPVAFVLLSSLAQVCQLYDTIRPSPAQQSAPTRQ